MLHPRRLLPFLILTVLKSLDASTPIAIEHPPLKHSPLVIGHRGSPGTHPEESFPAYLQAVKSGADYMECDIQVTRDNVLICSHEPDLSITDISRAEHRRIFPMSDRHSEVIQDVDGLIRYSSGWTINDYDWIDIKTVHLIQRYLERDHQYDGLYPMITLDQLIELGIKSGRGIYIESKDSAWYQNTRNVNLPGLMIKNLCRWGFCRFQKDEKLRRLVVKPAVNGFPCPIFLQSFLMDDLVYWNYIGASDFIPMVALVYDANNGTSAYGDIIHRILFDQSTKKIVPKSSVPNSVKLTARPVDLFQLKRLNVSAVGPDKVLILNRPEMVKELHSSGLGVHPWTFRNENFAAELTDASNGSSKTSRDAFHKGTFCVDGVLRLMDVQFEADPYREMKYFMDLGVDGLFTDFPGTLRNYLNIEERLEAVGRELHEAKNERESKETRYLVAYYLQVLEKINFLSGPWKRSSVSQ